MDQNKAPAAGGTAVAGNQFLSEFKDFVRFLHSLWGILAGISILFPLSNVLATKVIPLESLDHDGAFSLLAPALVTTLSTLNALFVILWTFSHREEFRQQTGRPRFQQAALRSFGAGALVLVLYIIGYKVTLACAYDCWNWESQAPQRLLAEVPLMLAYVLAFALVTRAFVLLGTLEFFSPRNQ